jgi:hypothetical protein
MVSACVSGDRINTHYTFCVWQICAMFGTYLKFYEKHVYTVSNNGLKINEVSKNVDAVFDMIQKSRQ